MYPVPQRIGMPPVAMSGRRRRAGAAAARMVSGDMIRTPSSSPPRQRISANRDSSFAVETVLDDGTTPVRKKGWFDIGMISCIVPPTTARKAARMGAGSGLPVGWLGATNGTSSGATP